jgi:hypothetical protein
MPPDILCYPSPRSIHVAIRDGHHRDRKCRQATRAPFQRRLQGDAAPSATLQGQCAARRIDGAALGTDPPLEKPEPAPRPQPIAARVEAEKHGARPRRHWILGQLSWPSSSPPFPGQVAPSCNSRLGASSSRCGTADRRDRDGAQPQPHACARSECCTGQQAGAAVRQHQEAFTREAGLLSLWRGSALRPACLLLLLSFWPQWCLGWGVWEFARAVLSVLGLRMNTISRVMGHVRGFDCCF